MGAWGYKSVENDDGLDWVADIEEKGIAVFFEFFESLDEDNLNSIDIIDSQLITLGGDIISYLNSTADLDVSKWIDDTKKFRDKILSEQDKYLDPEFMEKIMECLEAIIIPESDTYKIWNASNEINAWLSYVKDIIKKIQNI